MDERLLEDCLAPGMSLEAIGERVGSIQVRWATGWRSTVCPLTTLIYICQRGDRQGPAGALGRCRSDLPRDRQEAWPQRSDGPVLDGQVWAQNDSPAPADASRRTQEGPN